jgi:hypothetical protein
VTVSPSIAATVEVRRSRLFLGAVAVATIAAAITWALLTYATSTGSATSAPSGASGTGNAGRIAMLTRVQQAAAFGGPGAMLSVLYGLSPQEAVYVRGVTSMTPEQLAAAFASR